VEASILESKLKELQEESLSSEPRLKLTQAAVAPESSAWPIIMYPDPRLRAKARDIEAEDFVALPRLIQRMSIILMQSQGLGLAAPQIAVSQRVFLFRPDSEKLICAINPHLQLAGEPELAYEGCLSIGPTEFSVPRAPQATLRALDHTGGLYEMELEGLAARIAQHELDHLNGVLIPDHTTDKPSVEEIVAAQQEEGITFFNPDSI
jgi:peptide deformylase